MDREILFRAKSTDKGKWLYGDLYRDYIPESEIPYWYIYIKTKDQGTIPENVIPETAGQYTGFKDRNENKIFEGDILKHTCQIDGEQIEQNYLVKFTDGAFRLFQRIDDPWSLDLLNRETLEFEHYVVIGNIHDNKELME